MAPRLTPAAVDYYTSNFDSLNQGAEYVLHAFPVMARRALAGLKGRFSSGELSIMLDVMNGTALTAIVAGDTLTANVEDAIALDHLDEKWHVDKAEILKKMASLTPFETACLEIWARGFWAGDHYEGKGALEKYVGGML